MRVSTSILLAWVTSSADGFAVCPLATIRSTAGHQLHSVGEGNKPASTESAVFLPANPEGYSQDDNYDDDENDDELLEKAEKLGRGAAKVCQFNIIKTT